MKIKVESFLMKQGNRLGKAAIQFESEDGILAGFHLVGFTICEDDEKGLFVLFPAAVTKDEKDNGKARPFFFLRPDDPSLLDTLSDKILDVFEKQTEGFNKPRMKAAV